MNSTTEIVLYHLVCYFCMPYYMPMVQDSTIAGDVFYYVSVFSHQLALECLLYVIICMSLT